MRRSVPLSLTLSLSLALAAAATTSSCKDGARSGTSAPTVTPEQNPGSSREGQSAPDATPRITLRPNGAEPVTIRVEVQRTEQQRERGLMFRQSLDELAGMVFVFPRAEHQTFWMHNTYLPLDMIFITTDRKVLGVVENATPMTDDPREVPGDSQYVLEVRAGFAQRHHIARDTPVEFQSIPPAAE